MIKLVQRITKKAEEAELPLTDPSFHQNDIGHGRPALLVEQKKRIIAMVSQDRDHRGKKLYKQ
ncbi:hypothetical protein PSPO01_16219 [Paraphaeosphaeria sporulosa]